ncbi:MAG: tRNA (adenosine(37)-N6)-dimethylallyltransferase MiaA [Verrucomicrobiota bacterium]
MSPPAPLYLCGPTASGKSSLAVEIARQADGEVVNADAYQLYRGLETLTAAPTREQREIVPHHLFGVLDPDEGCDAMRFRELALPVIEEVLSRGKLPIVTGGSGLYLKFLTHGPSPLPTGDPAHRERLAALSLNELVERLKHLDPVEAARTDLMNRRYVTRAVEICELSGERCSDLRDRWETITADVGNKLRGIFIQRERADLHQRIHRRSAEMLDGAIEEVAVLGDASETLGMAIGYREVRELLDGGIDRETCVERIRTATRQYAKRQETWFRREAWLKPLVWAPDAAVPLNPALRLAGIRF